MILQEKAEYRAPLGLYVHVPFCPSTCDFCAFYQESPDSASVGLFLDGIEAELELIDWNEPVTTIFWGGGTPGLLAARDLRRLGQAISRRLERLPLEWTVEMAPSTVSAARMNALVDIGVNRISLGVQSFNDATLESLGRRHSSGRVFRAIDEIRAAGFENFNIDLIFAAPGQTVKSWETDLEEALRASPAHVSTYCLTFEEDTALYARLLDGKINRRTEEEECRFYELAGEILATCDYMQYEISNYARPGMECRHNVNTWKMYDWFGVGPSAASQRQGRRTTNIDAIATWYRGLTDGRPVFRENHAVDSATLAMDYLIFGLRMNRGVCLTEFRERFSQMDLSPFERYCAILQKEGLVRVSSSANVALTPRGRLLADGVAAEIMRRCAFSFPN